MIYKTTDMIVFFDIDDVYRRTRRFVPEGSYIRIYDFLPEREDLMTMQVVNGIYKGCIRNIPSDWYDDLSALEQLALADDL